MTKYKLKTEVDCCYFRYEHCRHRKRRCAWKTKHQVLSYVEEMSVGGSFIEGRKQGVSTKLPRGLTLWNTETMGHDIFKVYSKWKADPPDPDEITSANHPYLEIRKHA